MKQDVVTVIKYLTKTMKTNNEKYMLLALKEAKKAYDLGEVPVGAVIVKDDKVIAKAHNLRQSKKQVTGHAEIIAINKASKKLNAWILDECTIYVTLEPCLMCAGTIIQSRMKKVYYGAKEPKFGAFGSLTNLVTIPSLNHKVEVEGGILDEEASNLLKSFFQKLRKKDNSIDKNKE